MPIIRDISLSLKIREVLRREGFGEHSEIRPEIKILIRQLLASVKKTRLLEPAIAYVIYTINEISQRQLSLEGKPIVLDPLLPSLLPGAKELAFAVCTIGPRLEKQVTNYISRGEQLRGTLLDGIGSAAVDSLTEEVCKFIANEASSRGYETSSPINPGMPGLPITEQWNLLGLVKADEVGVSLTASGVLVPRKSASMVIGIGPKMKRWTDAEACARCSLRETCHYKVTE